MYQREYGKKVLFSETVPPTKNFNQTKVECIPVENEIWQDAALYFRAALNAEADEFGTHTKLMSTKEKGLRRTVPKNFPYFYIEWDSPSQGYAQIIESRNFRADFAVDTIAGMSELRLQRKRKVSADEERQAINSFIQKWQPYDWTVQLDDRDKHL